MLLIKPKKIETILFESLTVVSNVGHNKPISCQLGYEHYVGDYILICKFSEILSISTV